MAITRAEIEAAIEDEYNSTLLDQAVSSSTALNAFTVVPMGSKVTRMPALLTRPKAKFIGETGTARKKPSTTFSFEKKELVAAEVAAIIVLNEEDIEDADDDLLNRAALLGGEAIGAALDAAVLFGDDKPAAWTAASLFEFATAAGNIHQIGTGQNDLVGSIFQAAEDVDDSGANPDRFLARNGLRFRLANLRDANGAPIYLPSLSASANAVDNVGGLDAYWNTNGAWDKAAATAMVADSRAVLIGQRSDISVKFLDQAVVDGVSLAENDQVGLRFRARYGYTVADLIGAEGSRVAPVSAVVPATAG